ncbi:hypothetical protein SAMN06265795_11453 [Noviherbaspirillum humi]|uniref:Uncharacterized protein n=1 Tax=Noviherbaspirillum humi TaxID=1688639 RepID=A0A239K0A6_9BURK|nr:hypothetical protein [Noviherbaspirillum humi]SNT11103.1 hypothetical protein SAMN06265795_11453 [Noviherbaspirillum humi]
MSFVSASPNTTPAISSSSTLPSTSLPSPSPSQTVAFVDETAELARTGAWLLQTMVGLGLAVGGLFAYLANRFKQKPPRTLDDFNRTVLQGDPSKLPERVDKLVAKLSVNPVIKRNVATLGEQFKQALNTGDQAKAKEILSVLCVLETGHTPTVTMDAFLGRALQAFKEKQIGAIRQCILEIVPKETTETNDRFDLKLTAISGNEADPSATAHLNTTATTTSYKIRDITKPYSINNRVKLNEVSHKIETEPANPVILHVNMQAKRDPAKGLYDEEKIESGGACIFPEGTMYSTPRKVVKTWSPVPRDRKD